PVQIDNTAKCGNGIVPPGIIIEAPKEISTYAGVCVQTGVIPVTATRFFLFSIKGLLSQNTLIYQAFLSVTSGGSQSIFFGRIGKPGVTPFSGEGGTPRQRIRSIWIDYFVEHIVVWFAPVIQIICGEQLITRQFVMCYFNCLSHPGRGRRRFIERGLP